MVSRTKEEPGFPVEIPAAPDLVSLREAMIRCTRCELAVSRTQVVPGAGPDRAAVMVVGEAPGASEDREGVPFVGRSGRLLEEMLTISGIGREEIFIANVVRCRPPANRSPRVREIRACAGWLAEQIRLVQPSIVVVLGRFALQHFAPGARISQIQGEPQSLSYSGRKIRMFPLLHPAAVLRARDRLPEYEAHFRRLGELVATIR